MLPAVITAGRDLLQRFASFEGTTSCRQIRGNARVPLRCSGVVRAAPVLLAQGPFRG